ncbi:MAG: 5-oxoprolinase subunit B family protein [Ilumatobacteraceae bacterium]
MAVRILPAGPRAVLAEYDTLDDVLSAAAALRSLHLPGVCEIVPAARTVLVVHDGSAAAAVRAILEVPAPSPSVGDVPEPITLDVVYDGADLDDVAFGLDLSVEEVVALHTAPVYTVAFCGFVPGFAYLVGLAPALHLPRRSTPRPRVPAGSVAIASEYSAVYPSASPGGWHLLGHTDASMWDEERPSPALLQPGATVRFVPR